MPPVEPGRRWRRACILSPAQWSSTLVHWECSSLLCSMAALAEVHGVSVMPGMLEAC